MTDQKCKDRFEMYSSGAQSPTRVYPEFDGSSRAWFATGWNSKGNSLASTRLRLKEMFKLLPKDGSIPFSVFADLSKSFVDLGGEAFDLSSIVDVYLERFKPIRIVMREEGNKLKGLTELSFAMDLDEKRVSIFWSGKAYSLLGEHLLDAKETAKHNARPGDFIFDPLDPMCPAQIDWVTWLSATDKFGKRNAPFSLKQFEVEEEDAVLK